MGLASTTQCPPPVPALDSEKRLVEGSKEEEEKVLLPEPVETLEEEKVFQVGKMCLFQRSKSAQKCQVVSIQYTPDNPNKISGYNVLLIDKQKEKFTFPEFLRLDPAFCKDPPH